MRSRFCSLQESATDLSENGRVHVRVTNLLVPAFVAASVAWTVWLSVTPLLPAPLAAITYALGSLICHQRPERSFHLGVAQLPVCARCIGLYGGAAIGSLWAMLSRSSRSIFSHRAVVSRLVVALAAIPTAITLVAEWVGIWQPSNIVRALSGVPFGAAVALVVIGALTTLHYGECAPRRPIVPPPQIHI
jgi:uncharacterized membrane protein